MKSIRRIATAIHAAIISLIYTTLINDPTIFWMRTLEARKRVIPTEIMRAMLDQPVWGEEDMKALSLMHTRRQMEKKGSKQPLNT